MSFSIVPEHVFRMIEEEKALSAKTSKLSEFLNDDRNTRAISEQELVDMKDQFSSMSTYLNVLRKRMVRAFSNIR